MQKLPVLFALREKKVCFIPSIWFDWDFTFVGALNG